MEINSVDCRWVRIHALQSQQRLRLSVSKNMQIKVVYGGREPGSVAEAFLASLLACSSPQEHDW